MSKTKWYCYVCGRKLKKIYYLISTVSSTDRVFLVCDDRICMEQVDTKDSFITKVKEIK